MPSNYVIWAHGLVDGGCVLGALAGVERRFDLLAGVPRAAGFPLNASFAMDPEYPDDVTLTDSLFNTDMLVIASGRLATLFDERAAPALERLPVTIFDHRGRSVHMPYFILHPLEPVDCLVLDRCGAKRSRITPSMIKEIRHLVVDEARIPANRLLFRPLDFPRVTLIRRDVAAEIDSRGFNGMRWVELDNYPED